MGSARLPLTIGLVERIFQHNRWRYELVRDRILTQFNGVPMLIGVDTRRETVVLITPLYMEDEGARLGRARAQDVDTFLAAVNSLLPFGTYVREIATSNILYTLTVAAGGGMLDEDELKGAIAFVVGTIKTFGSAVDAMIKGLLTLDQALAALQHAISEMRRREV
jgi:hypothetical protein